MESKKSLKLYLFLILTLALSWWAISAFFQPGFFPVHDDTQVVRVDQMAQALKDGQFPVRSVKDLGYGYSYPIFNFYAPLPYYLAGLLVVLGLTPLLAAKVMMVAPLVLSGLTMFVWAQANWGNLGALVAALFYIYAPYKAVDAYVRGAVGELWVMVFLPLVFWSLQSFSRKAKTRPRLLMLSLNLAAIILSHNILAMLTGLVLAVVISFSWLSRVLSWPRLKLVVLAALLALGLSAWFWLPAISEAGLTKVAALAEGTNDYHQHFVYLSQLWNSLWGFAGSAPGKLDGLSFKIGKLHLLAAGFGLFLLGFKTKILVLVVIPLVFSVFMMLPASVWLWQLIPPLAFVQYPWRFLSLTILLVSFLVGASFKRIKTNLKGFLAVILVLGLFWTNQKLFQPQFYYSDKTNADYLQSQNVIWITSKISDEYLPKDFIVPESLAEVNLDSVSLLPETEVNNLVHNSRLLRFETKTEQPSQATINLAYFPWWQVGLNGEVLAEDEFEISPAGFIEINLPAGNNQVEIKLVSTPIRTVANLISLASVMACFGLKYLCRKGKENEKGS